MNSMKRTLIILLGLVYIIFSLAGCAPVKDKKAKAIWEQDEKWPVSSGKANIKTILEKSKTIR